MAFSIEWSGPASLAVYDVGEPVCEIRGLRLQNARFHRGGIPLIGAEVPLPLFWEQYANHQHPERNAGSHPLVRIIENGANRVVFECSGATASESVLSRYIVTLSKRSDTPGYIYDVHAGLRVADASSWIVTHNPHHGELEFCNLWPDGAFSSDARKPLRYDACYIARPGSTLAIPHHHFESPEKQNILLRPGSRVMWLLEDKNPCVEYLSGGEVSAGVCAYMWDVHLAYRVCHGGSDVVLRPGVEYSAVFRLSEIGEEEGGKIAEHALQPSNSAADSTPIVVEGVHTFSERYSTLKADPADVWPWENEVISGEKEGVRFLVDRETGMDDQASLRIDSKSTARSQWKATTLGPAFRQAPFTSGARYRLTAYVRSRLNSGRARIAIRLHREGTSGLFDPQTYDLIPGKVEVSGTSDWTMVEVITLPITPAPDRIHLLLEMDGSGTCWFDNVHFLREE